MLQKQNHYFIYCIDFPRKMELILIYYVKKNYIEFSIYTDTRYATCFVIFS